MPESPEEVRAIARRAVAAGYRALKLGWGPLGASLERDVELVAAAREELGPKLALMIDGGMAYSVKRAIQLVRELEPFGIHGLEEPLQADDYDGYRRLSDAVSVRIAAGEADSGLRPYRALVELGHVDVLQPDLARCGGFTVGRQIAELAAATGTEVVPHCFSTGILVAASLHFTAAIAGATYSEFSVADSPLVNGLLTEPFALDGEGRVAVPAGPGLGIRLIDDVVEALRYREPSSR